MNRGTPAFQHLREIYGWKDEYKKGRAISLISSLIASIYNVFITGIFYTGFLSMYKIDLVGVGIITFIGPLANCFFIFSPMILEKIQKRKRILAAAKIYYYVMVIIATNLMPMMVTSPGARVIWFCILQFLASSVYAVFSAGFTPWFYNFYPADQLKRAAYISYNQIFSAVMSCVILLSSGFLASLVSASGHQNTLILALRCTAFVLVLADVFFQTRAKEFPYPVHAGTVRLKEVFTASFKYRKFMACLILMFIWNYIANLNSGLWNFYLLNNVGFSYQTINLANASYALILFLFTPFWRKLLAKLSWVRTFALGVLIWVPTEIYFFFLTPVTKGLFFPGAIFQHFLSVGVNLGYSNIFYMNLPRENATTHTCFQSVGCNICAFLGMMTSTLWCKFFGTDTVLYWGTLPVTAVQFTTIARAVTMLALGWVLMKKWRSLTPDSELETLELITRGSQERGSL